MFQSVAGFFLNWNHKVSENLPFAQKTPKTASKVAHDDDYYLSATVEN